MSITFYTPELPICSQICLVRQPIILNSSMTVCSSEDIGQFKAFFIGLPSKWSQHLFRTVMLLLPLAFFAPLIIYAYRKARKLEENGRPHLSLFHRCMSVLLAYVILVGPWGFQQLAQADIAYSLLSTTDWASGNSTITYTYDANGSMETKTTKLTSTDVTQETVTYEYNLQGRLAKVTTTPYVSGVPQTSVVTEYKYNPSGIRVESSVSGGATTDYLIDSYNHTGYAQVFVETTGADKTAYIIGDDVLAQATGTGQTDIQYLLYDGHGSTRQLVASDGTTVDDSFSYDAYGVMLGGNPTDTSGSTSLLYAGEQFDTNAQLYYNRARYYNPNNGLFNRTDPYSGNNQDPQSLHKYAYTHNNPINSIDPTGMFLGASDVSAAMGIRISIQALVIGVGAIFAWKRFGPRGGKPDANQQRQIDAALMVINNNLLDKNFNLSSGKKIVVEKRYVDYNNYHVYDSNYKGPAGEHRPWPFQRIVLDEKIWFAMSPKQGSTVIVHELYHYFHWGFGRFEEKDAHELQTQVYIEL
ncbi:MAG: hypothetical protein KAS75_07390 [Planctomycetes bacterium]|nr:hypothetical protein [Planctomycetota bacterium]